MNDTYRIDGHYGQQIVAFALFVALVLYCAGCALAPPPHSALRDAALSPSLAPIPTPTVAVPTIWTVEVPVPPGISDRCFVFLVNYPSLDHIARVIGIPVCEETFGPPVSTGIIP